MTNLFFESFDWTRCLKRKGAFTLSARERIAREVFVCYISRGKLPSFAYAQPVLAEKFCVWRTADFLADFCASVSGFFSKSRIKKKTFYNEILTKVY